ncbi:MAG: TRAP transporter substrate-binding protein [Desulfotignum sp.]|nr:TRAP transporter substrate-binding protein [Desulfotignum sp.]MCF8088582.1 TRAP transporter substrate-binding protein [Desulfotignum sp.]MCF8136570.1 TRAP transporter substrate-binding protein [Desulfotignum sp.]
MSEKLNMGRRQFIKTGTVALAGAATMGILNPFPVKAKGQYLIRINNNFPDDELVPDVDREFMELLRKYSKDEFNVKCFYAGALGNALESTQKLQVGSLEIANISNSNLTPFVPLFNVLAFPYATGGNISELHGQKRGMEIVSSQIFQDICVKSANEKGLDIGFWTPIGFRQLFTGKHLGSVIKRPEDIKGVKVRVTGSYVERKMFEFLGANPVPIAWPEVFTSLQTGICDVLHNSSVDLYSVNFQDIGSSLTYTNFYDTLNLYVSSHKWVNSLPSHLQKAYRRACNEAQEMQRSKERERDAFCISKMKEAGVQYYTPTKEEAKLWYDAVNYNLPMWEPVIKKVAGDLGLFKKILSA